MRLKLQRIQIRSCYQSAAKEQRKLRPREEEHFINPIQWHLSSVIVFGLWLVQSLSGFLGMSDGCLQDMNMLILITIICHYHFADMK